MTIFRKILTTTALCLAALGVSSCISLNTHSGIAEYARCFPAQSLNSANEIQHRNGRYYIKAEIVNAMIWRNKIDGIIDLGPFAAPGRRDRVQSRTDSYIWLPISAQMASRLTNQDKTVMMGELLEDVTTVLRYRQAIPQSDGTIIPITATLKDYQKRDVLIISPEWKEKVQQARRSDYYSPFADTAPLQASGNYWARPAACLTAVFIDLPGTIVLSASAPIIVAYGLLCGYGPP